MSENKQEWFLSQKNINSTKLSIFKIYPYSRGIVVGNEKIEGKGLLELNFNQQDLEVEKFVFEKIHIVNLQIDDDMKVCIDIDKSLENFKNEFENSSPHRVKFLEKLNPLIEASRKQSEDLMKLMPLSGFSDITKQIKASIESIKPPAIMDPIDKLKFVNYKKYLQSQAKTFYRFCFEQCMLEKVNFTDEVKHELKFKKNIFLEYCNISNKTFLEKVTFLDNIFEQVLVFDKINFKKDLSLKACESKAEQCVIFSYSCFSGEVFVLGNQFKQMKIKSSIFEKNVYFGLDDSINPDEGFGYSSFSQSFVLKYVTFEKKVYFERSDFHFCVIDSCKFQDDTFFDYSVFNEARILKATFEQRASFYQVTFDQPPLFANCVFDKYLTMTGSKLVLDSSKFIDKVCDSARVLYASHNDNGAGTISRPNNEKRIEDFFKDYRDGFCTIKNALIKNNNLLDASNYHRVELYCKEIELDSKPDKTWQDRIDSLQLWFYRHICDHHTDLLRVWNSLMYLIFIFGALSFGAMAWFAYYFDDNFSLANCFDSTHLRIFYDSHIKFIIHKYPLHIWGINLGFIALFLFLLLGLTSKICRWVFIIPSYLVSIGMFAISPKLLMPAIGFFTDKREILDPLSIIGGAYTLLFGLIAYSLIKTARKNSIIPS